jgi:hypothetical protein
MPVLTPDEWKDKSVDVANDIAKQFITLALGGIAFAVGITTQDPQALQGRLFWAVIGGFAVSGLLGFGFLMHGVSHMAEGRGRLDLYQGAARWAPVLQIAALSGAMAALLVFHVNAVARKAGVQETRLTIQQGGKDTILAVQPGKAVMISVSQSGELKAEIK